MLNHVKSMPLSLTFRTLGNATAVDMRSFTYWYGPAINLKGLSVSGQQLEFDRPLANFIEIAAYFPEGSCPYVFSYDDRDRERVRHGKIIDNASAPEKEMTGRVWHDGLVTRFRIREEEPETTFVHRVRARTQP
jgi:hypothetical protein